MAARIDVDHEKIVEFCRRHHIRRLALFGSVLRDDFGPESDVDVLVEFEPDHISGLAFFDMQRELSGIIGRNVDLNTPGFLSDYFRGEVLREAEVPHAARDPPSRSGRYHVHARGEDR
jgi:predicted nucleotidyltransferase